MKLIYVASPYAGDIQRNTEFAKKACRHVMSEGHAFFAPHLLYPQLLDDNRPQEREQGIEMGITMLYRCDELWCYGECISQGMVQEIATADKLGIPIRRVMEQESGFIIGNPKQMSQTSTPEPVMRMS